MEETHKLGEEIARRGHGLIFGGGGSGLMGACARGAISKDGRVIGVVPKFMNNIEPIFDDCTQIIRTETMADRKQVMEDNGDAFVIAPGGIGTFDEFFQILTLHELRRNDGPIILFNIAHYYDDLIAYIDKCIEKGFIRSGVEDLFDVCDNPTAVLDRIEEKIGKIGTL